MVVRVPNFIPLSCCNFHLSRGYLYLVVVVFLYWVPTTCLCSLFFIILLIYKTLWSSQPVFSGCLAIPFRWPLNADSTVVLIVNYSRLSYKPYLLFQIKSRLAHAWQAINQIPNSEGTPFLLYFVSLYFIFY